MERAALVCTGPILELGHLPRDSSTRLRSAPPLTPLPSSALALIGGGAREGGARDERARIVGALETCVWNQTRAAKLLGISRGTLVSRLAEYKIPRPRKPISFA